MAYTKSRLTLDLSKCKQSGPYEGIATELKYSDTVGNARSLVTLLLDFLARLQRLPLILQTPRLEFRRPTH